MTPAGTSTRTPAPTRTAPTRPRARRGPGAGPGRRPAKPATPATGPTPSAAPGEGRRRLPFLLLVAGLLGGSLVALLLLNTFSAQDSFRLNALQQRSATLADTEQSLALAVAQEDAPGTLAAKAAALGMVPGGAPLFLKLPSGQVLGVAAPAPRPTPTPSAVPSPISAAKPSPTPSAKLTPTGAASGLSSH